MNPDYTLTDSDQDQSSDDENYSDIRTSTDLDSEYVYITPRRKHDFKYYCSVAEL